jgi:hypothetical protein
MRNNQDRLGPGPGAAQSAPGAASNLSFVVPTEFVELPSRGKFYPDDHPLHNQETVEIKFMTAKEEDILASATLIKKGLIIDRLLENLLVCGTNPTTLLVGDRAAIMIAARISSYGYVYKANTTCSDCKKEQEYNFDLRKTNLQQNCFDNNFLTRNKLSFNNEKNTFEILLPKSKVELGIKLLTGQNEKEPVGSNDESVITNLLSKFVFSVGGDEDSLVVSQFIDNMLAADSRYLRAILGDITPDIDLKQEFVCKHCGTSEDKEVPLTAEFFWPE